MSKQNNKPTETKKEANPRKQYPAYQVTISGSYRVFDGDVVDFQNVSGVVPTQKIEFLEGMIRKRYAPIWLERKGVVKKVKAIREIYIDDLVAIDAHEFSMFEKSVVELSQEELQDLATVFSLAEVPLYKKGSERYARGIAYTNYFNNVLGGNVSKLGVQLAIEDEQVLGYTDAMNRIIPLITDYKVEGFNLAKCPKIHVKKSDIKANGIKVIPAKLPKAEDENGEFVL